jgi:ribosomal protein L27
VGLGRDYTLFALKSGRVKFHQNRRVEVELTADS